MPHHKTPIHASGHGAPKSSKASGSKKPDDGSPVFFYRGDDEDFGFLSNFYYQSFTTPNPALWICARDGADVPNNNNPATIEFKHSEQYFMYCKALYFDDEDTAWMILTADQPKDCKSLGRAIPNFSQEKWEKDEFCVRVMEEALWWKFGGGDLSKMLQAAGGPGIAEAQRLEAIGDLGRRLLATQERQLIEAASKDRYWGIGYGVKEGPQFYKKNWGRNQLGKSLMKTRKRLAALVAD